MNRQDRARIKNAVIYALKMHKRPLNLPLPIKAITKSWPHVRLIPYSKEMQLHNLSYRGMLAFAGSEDGCTVYDATADCYVVYYNNIDEAIMSSYRYRWNIAHELGHIALNHHKDYKESRIYRNSLSKTVYAKLENEADMFAAYILVPHIVLDCIGIQNESQVIDVCKISGKASQIRMADLNYWRRHGRCEQYDFELLNLFSEYVETHTHSKRICGWLNKYRRCCHCAALLPLNYSYCKICGTKTHATYKLEVPQMTFDGIAVDVNGRALECPVCHNTDLYESGTFCVICGAKIVNLCAGLSDEPFQRVECKDDIPLPGNARFCPHCGSITTFFKEKYISIWASQGSSKAESKPFLDIDDSDLPF